MVSSPNVELLHVENITDYKVEGGTSQYQDEETRTDVSSDNGEVFDPTYNDEASCEDNDERGFSSQEEDNDSASSSSHELDVACEEERNDESICSYESKSMSNVPKSKNEFPVQNYAN